MDIYTVVARDDIAERWHRALLRDVQRLPVDLAQADLPEAGICIVHLDSTTDTQRDLLISQSQRLRLIVLTDQPSTEKGRLLVRQGVRGFGNTYVTPSLLQQMVRSVEQGDIWAGPEVLQSVLRQLLDHSERPAQTLSDRYGLSEREREVLQQVMTGASNKVVARQLDITERTVKAHMSAILNKTGVHDRVELILLAQSEEQKAV